MIDLYTEAAASAQRLIRKFGAKGAIRREASGSGPSYDPGEPTITDHAAHIVTTTFSSREIDGQRILTTDIKALVEPSVGIEPKTTDLLIAPDGAILTIVNVDLVRPATTTVLYKLQVRA